MYAYRTIIGCPSFRIRNNWPFRNSPPTWRVGKGCLVKLLALSNRHPVVELEHNLGSVLARGAAGGMALTLASNLFLFLGQMLVPRILSRGGYAEYAVSISAVGLFSLFADLGMTSLFTREFAQAEEENKQTGIDRRGTLVGTAAALRLSLTIVVAGLILLLGPVLYSASLVGNMLIASLALLFSSRILVVRAVTDSVLRSRNKFWVASAFMAVDSLSFAIVMFLLRSGEPSVQTLLWAYVLTNVPGFLLSIGWIARWSQAEDIHFAIDSRTAIHFLRAAVPLSVATGFFVLYNEIDKLLLYRLSSETELSGYAAIQRITAAMVPIGAVVAGVAAPAITRLLGRRDHVRSQRLTGLSLKLLLTIACVICIAFTFMNLPLTRVIVGEKYTAEAWIIGFGSWLFIPMFISHLLTEMCIASGRYWSYAFFMGFSMVGVIIFDVILIPSAGAAGAMQAKLTAVGVATVVLVLVERNSEFFDARRFLHDLVRVTLAVVLALITGFGLQSIGINQIVTGIAAIIGLVVGLLVTNFASRHELAELYARLRLAS